MGTLDLENSMYSQYLINGTVGSKKSAQIYFGRYIINHQIGFFSTPGNERKKTKIFENILKSFVFLSFKEVQNTLYLENLMYSQYLINRIVGSKKTAQIIYYQMV